MRLSLLSARDWLLFIVSPLIAVGFCTGLTFDHADSPHELIGAAWLTTGVGIGISVLQLYWKTNLGRVKRYYSQHQIWVGWTEHRYAVDINDFDVQVAWVLLKLSPKYPDAWKALSGCTVVFRESEWIQLETLRRVRGEQAGPLIVVGWTSALARSALRHELGHRILEVCASLPGEEESHLELVKHEL